MANKLSKSTTVIRKMTTHYTVSQTADSSLYTAVSNGTVKLPANSFVTLVTSGNVKTTKMTGDAEGTWAQAESITIAAKTQIAALTTVSTADGSDAATTQTLANALKVKVDAIIAALKA